jgi:asparagine synthase (glutamine-hydrolysing)
MQVPYWQKDNIALGHRRLKIIDLSDLANQPMLSEDQKVSLVFNGEIYNYKQLKQELISKGHTFKTTSDTEVLLKSYQEWGVESFSKFNGMFAFAIIDLKKDNPVAYVVRDRWGIKPLYYHYANKQFSFCSTPQALIKLPWVDHEISQTALGHYFKFAHFPQDETIYKNVFQLKPSTYIKYEKGNIELVKYFDTTQIYNPHPEFIEKI